MKTDRGVCFIATSVQALSDTDLFADLQSGVTANAVETAEFADGGIVVDRDSAECIAGLDRIPAHCLSFRIFLLVFFLVLHLVFKILLIVAVDAEVLLLKDEETVTELAFLEVDKPLRIECIALVSCLEVEVRAC